MNFLRLVQRKTETHTEPNNQFDDRPLDIEQQHNDSTSTRPHAWSAKDALLAGFGKKDLPRPPPAEAFEVHEEPYLALSVAKRKLAEVAGDMAEMRERHLKALQSIDENYKKIEATTQDYFICFVKDLQEKASKRAQELKQSLQAANHEVLTLKEIKTVQEEAIKTLRLKLNELLGENQKLLETLKAERASYDSRIATFKKEVTVHSSAQMHTVQEEVTQQLVKLKEQHDIESQRARVELEGVQGRYTAVLDEKTSVDEQLAALRGDLERTRNELDCLQRAFEEIRREKDSVSKLNEGLEVDSRMLFLDKENLSQDKEMLEQQRRDLERARASLEETNAALMARAQHADEQVQRLEHELAELRLESHSAATASAGLRSDAMLALEAQQVQAAEVARLRELHGLEMEALQQKHTEELTKLSSQHALEITHQESRRKSDLQKVQEDANERLDKVREDLEEQIAGLSEEKTFLRESLASAEERALDERHRYEAQLEELRSRIQTLIEDQERIDVQHQREQDQLLEKMEREQKEAREEIEMLRLELEMGDNRKDIERRHQQELDHVRAEWEAEVLALNTALATANEHPRADEATSSLKLQLQQLQERCTDAENQCHALQVEAGMARKEGVALQQVLKRKEDEMITMNLQLADMRKQIDQGNTRAQEYDKKLDNEVAARLKEVLHGGGGVGEGVQRMVQMERKVNTLEKQLRQLTKDRDADKKKFQADLEHMKKRAEAAEKECAALKTEVPGAFVLSSSSMRMSMRKLSGAVDMDAGSELAPGVAVELRPVTPSAPYANLRHLARRGSDSFALKPELAVAAPHLNSTSGSERATTPSTAPSPRTMTKVEDLSKENDGLRGQVQALRDELTSLQKASASTKDRRDKEMEEAKKLLQQDLSSIKQEISKTQAERDKIMGECAAKETELQKLKMALVEKAQLEKEKQALEEESHKQQAEVARVVKENERLQREVGTLQQSVSKDKEGIVKDMISLREAIVKERDSMKHKLQDAAKQLDKIKKDRDDSRTEVQKLKDELNKLRDPSRSSAQSDQASPVSQTRPEVRQNTQATTASDSERAIKQKKAHADLVEAQRRHAEVSKLAANSSKK